MERLRQQKELEELYWRLQEKVGKAYKSVDLDAIRAVFGVLFTFNLMEGIISKRLTAAGLTLPSFNSLMLLAHGNPEGYPLNVLSKFLVSSRANITGIVDSLAGKGFVERLDHPEDRRVVLAKITPAGRKWLDDYFPGHARMMASFGNALTQKERKDLLKLLAKMRDGIIRNLAEDGTAS